ncbi:MAG: PD40 domain-containing protein [Planctomycetes bacterium]|nr:PD40 domain-containing protein [Planctomycetota bacterium]
MLGALLAGCLTSSPKGGAEDQVAADVDWNDQFSAALLSAGRGTLWIYDVDSNRYVRVPGSKVDASSPVWSPDGTMLHYREDLGETINECIGIIRRSGTRVTIDKKSYGEPGKELGNIAWTPWNTVMMYSSDEKVYVDVDPRSGSRKVLIDDPAVCSLIDINSTRFAPDGTYLVFGSTEGGEGVCIYHLAERKMTEFPAMRTWAVDDSWANVVSPDSKLIAIGCGDGTPQSPGNRTTGIYDPHGHEISRLPFAEDAWWSPGSSKLLLYLPPRKDGKPSYDYSVDSRRALKEGEKNLVVADVKSGQLRGLALVQPAGLLEEFPLGERSSLSGDAVGCWLKDGSGIVMRVHEPVPPGHEAWNGKGFNLNDARTLRITLDGTIEEIPPKKGFVALVPRLRGELMYVPAVGQIKN